MGIAWKFLQKDLKCKDFKPFEAQDLSPTNKVGMKSALQFWLTIP